MLTVKRYIGNPILMPDPKSDWEAYAVLNGNVLRTATGEYHMLYRAISNPRKWYDSLLRVSTIGHATSTNGIDFSDRTQFLVPEMEWDKYGCEDPRVTFIEDKYYIFYTALSTNPPSPQGIRVGVAVTKDFKTIEERHLVTPFNAKAMALFPEKINGKYAVILTADTDNPPAKISIALLDTISQLWDTAFWENWYADVAAHTISLQRRARDHMEVGAVPIKTEKGWLLIYSYIQDYFEGNKVFGVEAALLDLDDSLKVIGRTTGPFLIPEAYPEIYGLIPNIVFPTGAVIENDTLNIYYGASDTSICRASLSLQSLISDILGNEPEFPLVHTHPEPHLQRFEGNPILEPLSNHHWEAKGVLNAGIFRYKDSTYILYRAIGEDFVSTIGLAETTDGFHITKRFDAPIYSPRIDEEKGGCEDPRVTQIDDSLIMHYTAFNGQSARVAHTEIKLKDFLEKKWNWEMPKIISGTGAMDKNSAVFPEKIRGKYAVLHRLDVRVWIDFIDDFAKLSGTSVLGGQVLFSPRSDHWDSEKIGIAGPPFKTDLGWLLIYHAISSIDENYRLGIILLDTDDPTKILLRLDKPILEPKLGYENTGIRPGAIFSCGSAIIDDTLFVYYGAGDTTLGVARTSFSGLMEQLRAMRSPGKNQS